MNLTQLRASKIARRWILLGLTAILVLIILFLLYISEDIHWGKDYWTHWLMRHFQYDYHAASGLVLVFRKGLHFLGYGILGCFTWFYFYFWRIPKSLRYGLILTTGVAVLDEYTQSLTSFRSGKPQDVMLDIAGALVICGIVKFVMMKIINHSLNK